MQFGAFIPQGWRLDLVNIPQAEHWPLMSTLTGILEDNGYASAWVFDHFHTFPHATQEVTYEAWTLMSALAASTDTIRLGQMCTCNSYRQPSYLAKVASSIDVISDGRLEMGIGAGWYEGEYLGFGYEFPKASVRIGMLREAVEIMRAMWTEDEVSYEGKYYHLQGAINQPKGVQQPHIPLWIAGGGEKLTLNVAARYANYTNFGGSPEEFVHKSEVLAGHCRDVGRNFDEIVRSSNLAVICAATEAELGEKKARLKANFKALVPDDIYQGLERMVEESAGTPEQIVERLRPWVDAGSRYVIVYFPDFAYDQSGVKLFAKEVIPAFI